MNTETFNARYPVGTAVVAYPDVRPEHDAQAERLITRTRSAAQVLSGHTDVVWVEGHPACIALTHVDPICGSRCPDHDHVCLRSPQHQRGICRDQKQKGTESCTWDADAVSAAVKGLARLVSSGGEGCWIMRTPDNCALLVPEGERLVFRRSFKRSTVGVAARLGLIVLGAERVPVPPFVGAPKWLIEFGFDSRTGTWALEGRTIAAGGAK